MVIKARHRETGQIVAIKKFKESDEDEQVRKTALREVRILKQLRHENIVNLIEVFRRKGKLHLVFEFVERTILEELERNPEGLGDLGSKKVLWQLLRAIAYCHSHHVIHRDIKPENLLLSKHGALKLCDFGFARTLSDEARYTDYVATRWYRAPELLAGDTAYGPGVDIWAVGCMLAELATGAPLFPGESDTDQLHLIVRSIGDLPERLAAIARANPHFEGHVPPSTGAEAGAAMDLSSDGDDLAARLPGQSQEALDFLRACLTMEAGRRPSAEGLAEHSYFDEPFKKWFEAELRRIMEKEAAEFKMRGRRLRKQSGGAQGSRAQDGDAGAGPGACGARTIASQQQQQQQGARKLDEAGEALGSLLPAAVGAESPRERTGQPGVGPVLGKEMARAPALALQQLRTAHTRGSEIASAREFAQRVGNLVVGGAGVVDVSAGRQTLLPDISKQLTPRAKVRTA